MFESNRVAIVTGASRGLGEVIARVLADRHYDLVVGARSAGALRDVADALSARGSKVVAVDGDVTDASVRTDSGGVPALARMLESAIEKHAACAAAINCSGFDPGPSSKRDLNV